ncbi:MAG: single-stranded-DNA-specific exonuclease RecJ [Spirochaetia bacterium]|nr:single-stranded-DNA-specific exonuclease RecJ [Spirochaetia bacterium]
MKYNKKFIDSSEVKELASKYKISLLMASILARRGVTRPEDIKFYLQDDIRYLHNPFLFSMMEDAVDRILDAISEKENIMIFGDRDTDGITSTVLMVKYLEKYGLSPLWKVPEGDDPYGLTMEAVDYAASRDVTLLITVDCGISCRNEIAYAATRGIDTIVLDHHTAPETMPECTAIINPKVPDCGYPFRDLAGCGVVAKMIWALEFSRTDFYRKNITLLNIKPGNSNSIIFEAVKLYNLVEVSRITETFVPGVLKNIDSSRLINYFSGSAIITFGARNQKRLFSEIFSGIDLQTWDLAPEIYSLFPQMNGMGLLKLTELSKESRYSSSENSEIDTLIAIFKTILLKKSPELCENYGKILPFAALGTIADLMPLRDENRIIVKKGLQNIASTENKGLLELLTRQKIIDKTITSTDIAWYISPVINASGRMGEPSTAVRLFLSDDIQEVRSLCNKILDLNKQRKKLGEEYWEKLTHSAKESHEKFSSSLVCTGGKGVPRGITGILASKFSNYFNAPAIIYSVLDDKIIGSIRSIRNYSIMPLLDYCKEFFIDYGGHDFAGGFSLLHENLDNFKNRLNEFIENEGIEIPDKPPVEIDAELPEGYLTEEILDIASSLTPYGEACPPLYFLAKRLTIRTMDIVGQKEKGHLKLTLDTGKILWPAIFWNSADRAVKEFQKEDRVNVIFRVENNFFRNKSTPQLVIQDMEK